MSMLLKPAHVFLLKLGYKKVKGGMARKCAVPPLIEQVRQQKYITVFIFSVNYQGLNLGFTNFDKIL